MQEKIKIIYLGSAPVSVRVFDLLYKNPQVEICAVWTKPDQPAGRGKRIMENPVKIKALASGIPEKNIFTLNPSDPESIKLLAGVNCNLGLIAAFGKILPENFFSIPSCGMYNIHFSLLPAYRGASPVQSALLDGISETGVTLQKITAGLDEGEIILQKKFSINGCYAEDVFNRALACTEKILCDFIGGVPGILNSGTPQTGKAVYCKKISKLDGLITGKTEIQRALNMLRAFSIWPGCVIIIGAHKFRICRGSFYSEHAPFPAGTLFRENRKLLLTLPGGIMQIEKIKPENKKELAAADFLNGTKLEFPCLLSGN